MKFFLISCRVNEDGFAKSPQAPILVILVETGIQVFN
jgi:hypothetical protein